MKHKQTYFTLGSTFLVIFMMLGYVVKFYPEAVTGLDSSIQLSVRGDLPAHLTATLLFPINQIVLLII